MVTPLGKGIGPRHWAAADYAVGVLLGVILYAAITHTVRQEIVLPPGVPRPGVVRYYPLPWAGPLGLVLVTVAAVAVALRRRRPMVMLGVLLAGSVVVTALAGSRTVSLTYFLPVCYVLFLIAANYEQRRDAVRALVAVFATLFADTALMGLAGGNGPGPHGALVTVSLCVIVVWTAGYLVRQRRRYAVRLQEEAASKAVTQERLRIARELHDVVAHSMSVIAVQAGYGQYVIDTQPGDARAALGAIQATSREALDEIRRMLGALRHADEPDAPDDGAETPEGSTSDAPATGTAPLSPAPGLTDLDRLLSRTAGAGVEVDVIRRGHVRELPASIDLSAYRIVQEALTNVVKHAQTSCCRVLIGYWDDELVIEVTDNGAGLNGAGLNGAGLNGAGLNGAGLNSAGLNSAGLGVPVLAGAGRPVPASAGAGAAGPGIAQARRVFSTDAAPPARSLAGGHGIIGMRERVSLLGGEFSAGPLRGYGFRVSARIPLPPGGP